MSDNRYSPFFRFVCRALKYYLLSLAGFTLACLLAGALGAFDVILAMLPDVLPWLLRLASLNGCLLVAAVILESLRN